MALQNPVSPEMWYAVRVKPRHEKSVTSALEHKLYDAFLPFYRVRRQWSDRVRQIELPLFPRYVFCRFHTGTKLPVLQVPGVLGIVGFGGVAVPVEDEEISALREVLQTGLPAQPHPYLKAGQKVRIESGPLSGVCGILQPSQSSRRLIVSITLLQRSVSVEIDADWVSPMM